MGGGWKVHLGAIYLLAGPLRALLKSLRLPLLLHAVPEDAADLLGEIANDVLSFLGGALDADPREVRHLLVVLRHLQDLEDLLVLMVGVVPDLDPARGVLQVVSDLLQLHFELEDALVQVRELVHLEPALRHDFDPVVLELSDALAEAVDAGDHREQVVERRLALD